MNTATMSTVTTFFTSVFLLESLLEHYMYACGTVQRDCKGFPSQLSQRGKYQAMQHELVVTVWRYKKDVVTLPT